MADLACWRQENGIVLRVHGSEHLLDEDAGEVAELLRLFHKVVYSGYQEACSTDYLEAREAEAAARANPNRLLSLLGRLLPKAEFKRRF